MRFGSTRSHAVTAVSAAIAAIAGAALPVAAQAKTTVAAARSVGAPITSAQAFQLSRGLYLNGQAGGADVHATVPYGVATIDLRAVVDWKGGFGKAALTTVFSDGSPRQASVVFWSASTVLSTLNGLEAAMKAKGRSGIHFVAHRMDPNTTTLDRVLSFISHLASDRSENPVLLRQSGMRWLGRMTRDGVTGDVYEGAKQTRYWIDPTSKRLLRVEARLQDTSAVAVFDISHPGPRTVTSPALAEIVRIEEVPDVYAKLAGGGPKP